MTPKERKEFHAWWNIHHDPNVGWVENAIQRTAAMTAWQHQLNKLNRIEALLGTDLTYNELTVAIRNIIKEK